MIKFRICWLFIPRNIIDALRKGGKNSASKRSEGDMDHEIETHASEYSDAMRDEMWADGIEPPPEDK